jgi:hypothetical protein
MSDAIKLIIVLGAVIWSVFMLTVVAPVGGYLTLALSA